MTTAPEILDLWRDHLGSLADCQEDSVYNEHRDEYLTFVNE